MKTSSAPKKTKKKKNDVDGATATKEHEMQQHKNGKDDAFDFRNAERKAEQDVEATAREVAAEAEKAEKKAKTVSYEEYEKLKGDYEEAKDRGLRALAELENFRARANRIAQEDRKYASLELARAILPVWDNMGRAIEAAEKNKNVEALVAGVKMMYKEFLDILAKHRIVAIDALHKPFDPNFHESIAFIPNDEFPPNTVVVESQKGFRLHDRVVRPTQVVLATPSSKPSENVAKNDDERAE